MLLSFLSLVFSTGPQEPTKTLDGLNLPQTSSDEQSTSFATKNLANQPLANNQGATNTSFLEGVAKNFVDAARTGNLSSYS